MFSKQLFSDLVARCWGAQSEDVSVFRRFGQVARAVGESEQWCLICAGITDHLYMRNELWGFSPRHTNVSIPGNPLSDSIRQFLVKMPLISYICTKEQDWKCFSDQRPRFKLITQLTRNAITWISVFVCTLLSNAQQRANIRAFVTLGPRLREVKNPTIESHPYQESTFDVLVLLRDILLCTKELGSGVNLITSKRKLEKKRRKTRWQIL